MKQVRKSFPHVCAWPSRQEIWCVPGVGFAARSERDIFKSLDDILKFYSVMYSFSQASRQEKKESIAS
jgi:hypothetical protein